jgi:hypothetical protein
VRTKPSPLAHFNVFGKNHFNGFQNAEELPHQRLGPARTASRFIGGGDRLRFAVTPVMD